MKYSCGCINEVDPDSGVLRCVHKCDYHVEFLRNQNQDCYEYYLSLGCIQDGIPQNLKYIWEFKNAFAEIHGMPRKSDAVCSVLEVGCGIGMYVPMFQQFGWYYTGIETSKFASQFTHNNHDVEVWTEPFEVLDADQEFHGILAAHVIEHMKKAPAMLSKMRDFLVPGGSLWIIVPDDSDPVNPDHWWFFNVRTLHALLEKIGFKNVRSTTRKLIERENFIYCVAEK